MAGDAMYNSRSALGTQSVIVEQLRSMLANVPAGQVQDILSQGLVMVEPLFGMPLHLFIADEASCEPRASSSPHSSSRTRRTWPWQTSARRVQRRWRGDQVRALPSQAPLVPRRVPRGGRRTS